MLDALTAAVFVVAIIAAPVLVIYYLFKGIFVYRKAYNQAYNQELNRLEAQQEKQEKQQAEADAITDEKEQLTKALQIKLDD